MWRFTAQNGHRRCKGYRWGLSGPFGIELRPLVVYSQISKSSANRPVETISSIALRFVAPQGPRRFLTVATDGASDLWSSHLSKSGRVLASERCGGPSPPYLG